MIEDNDSDEQGAAFLEGAAPVLFGDNSMDRCNYRLGDALVQLSLLVAFIGYLVSEAIEMPLADAAGHWALSGCLVFIFFCACFINRSSRAADVLKRHRELQQRLLGVPPDEMS